ncbi:hypothetical protein [Latilactobacillus phage TMW 1.706 P1]|nr:hypothetical protein [Latilactobacillus curvatus]MDG2988167.1 hypothetical protein [Latilactobacillus curvatus]WCZ54829.1 hypothetical protein [Latilactobacillus phage TMW 1.706 P1]GED82706.1 hypothetical protein LCU01_16140 [Latilactobacillus curvatus]
MEKNVKRESDYCHYLANQYSKETLQNGLDKVTQLSMYLKGALKLIK